MLNDMVLNHVAKCTKVSGHDITRNHPFGRYWG
jgi:hypothetical protein